MKDKDLLQWAEDNVNRRSQQISVKKELLQQYRVLREETKLLLREYDKILEQFE